MVLERDFAAWADRHDADALARVFDATAGRLLLIASQLGGASASAEDLVQTTFLAAMANASGWDRARPLWPWLLAILRNEARRHWRRQRHRRETGIEAADDEVVDAGDPARLAASEEAFAALVAAIDALPLPYRQVLRLRLVHGLQPVQIARALEVPVGTVRAQLHRGLERLRTVLPAGLGGIVAALLGGEAVALAQARVQVLARAVATRSAGTAATAAVVVSGGWWAMNGKSIGIAAVGVVALLSATYLMNVPRVRGAAAAPPPAPAPVGASIGGGVDDHASDAEVVLERTEAATLMPAAWPLTVVVKTRAGEPIAGATVQLRLEPHKQGMENADTAFRGDEELEIGETGPDGLFQRTLDALRQRSSLRRATSVLVVEATHPSYDRSAAWLALPREGAPQRFAAEIALAPSLGIVGRVVDRDGIAVGGAQLYLRASRAGASCRPHGRAQDDGRFRVGVDAEALAALNGGELVAAAPGSGVGVVQLPAIEASATSPRIDVGTVMLAGGDSVRGCVVLGDGSGLGDYPIWVQRVDAEVADDPTAVRRAFYESHAPRDALAMRDGQLVQVRTVDARTGADGSFVCSGLAPGELYAVAVRDAQLRMIATVARVGGEPVRLVADRQLLVIDACTVGGERLPGAATVAEAFDPSATRASPRVRPSFQNAGYVLCHRFLPCDAEGRRLMLAPFGWMLRLSVSDEAVQAFSTRHDVLPGVHRADRTLVLDPETRFGSLRLRVVDERGEPFRDFGYDLTALDRDCSRHAPVILVPPTDGMVRDLPAGRWHVSVHVGKALRYGRWGSGPTTRGDFECEVTIEHGRTTELEVATKPLGRVAFRVAVDGPVHQLHHLSVSTFPDGQRVDFDLLQSMDDLLPGRTASELLFARTAFAPGRHAFVVTAKDHEPVHCTADVKADRTAEVEVVLARN